MERVLQKALLALSALALATTGMVSQAQQGFFTREDVIKYTPDWKGERFDDGRPKVPDDVLDRMKNVTLEEGEEVHRRADRHALDPGDRTGLQRLAAPEP